jgi:iron complex transport system substrate-binding protein
MKKWKFLAAAGLTLMLAACGSDDEVKDTETGKETEQASSSEQAEQSAFPMKVSSLTAGRETEEGKTITFEDVTLEEEPQRIVVFDYGFLDTLDALGVEGVVAVAKNGGDGNLPDGLKAKYFENDSIADVGTLKSIDFEAVAASNPDVIFISGRQAGFYEELKEITPNVIYIGSDNEDYFAGVFESVDLAAQIFGKEDKAEELKSGLQAKIDAVNEKAKGYENALIAMYNDKKISGFDNGPESRFAYFYNDFGFTPATTDIEASSHGSDFSYESILAVDPEVLVIVDRTASEVDVVKAEIENDIVKQTRAYKEGKIVYLDGITWYFSGGGVTTEEAKLDEILNELK